MNKLKVLLINFLFLSQNCFSQNTKITFDPSDNFDGGFKNTNDFYINLTSVLICFIAPFYIAKNKFGDDASLTYWKWWFILVATSMLTALIFRDYTITMIVLIAIGFFGLTSKEEKINDEIQEKKESRKSVETYLNIEDVTSKNVQFNNSSKEKIKTIPCINCKQKLRLTAVANKELEITCPNCRQKWVANFKTLL
jgi:hypothetical protein